MSVVVRSAVRFVRWWCTVAGVVLLTCGAITLRSRATTPEEINKAIKKGVDFLYSQQSDNGDWDAILKPNEQGKWSGDVKQACGPTALAVYALLTAGESPKDPRIVKAYDYLKRTQTGGTYAIGFRANAYAMFPITDEVKRLLAGDAQWIKTSFQLGKDVKRRGFYGYGSAAKSGYDRSTSQAAVLGAWGCAQVGDTLGSDYWRITEEAWRKAQFDDGGWNYNEYISNESLAMTASGVATLFITQEYLHLNDYTECKGSANDAYIEKGLKWLGTNFKVPSEAWGYYSLFAVERCGAASGYRYFGEHDWFKEGADWLVKNQAENGSWEGTNNPSTSFALLFLGRGRAPVAINKLQYTKADVGESNVPAPTGANWNQRPRDVPNICRWTGRQQERTLNFQIVSIDSPAESFSDSPILYVSGNQPLKFSEEKVEKLKKFVEEGGLILGNADCSSKPFADSFRKLGKQMFPDYEFRVLPPDSPVFEQFPAKQWKTPPNLLGLNNGARELMVLYASGDPGKYWQLHMLGGHEEMHQSMADILAYAVDRDTVRFKGQTQIVRPEADKPAEKTLKLARLRYPGNWDPEAGAWRRMIAILHNQQRIDLAIETVDLGEGKLDGKAYPLAHLTGTASYKLNDKQKQELKSYVAAGGTLLVDACGGSSAFATDIEPELATLFAGGKAALDVLQPDHKLFTTDVANEPAIKEVDYRPFARKTLGAALKTPQLRGAEANGRLAVIFSREDLTAGMVGEPIGGILGYTPKSATAIVQHVLLSVPATPLEKKSTEENKAAGG
jgi:hypothetical protein